MERVGKKREGEEGKEGRAGREEGDLPLTLERIHHALESQAYVSNPAIDGALYGALLCEKPLLLEGDAGVQYLRQGG